MIDLALRIITRKKIRLVQLSWLSMIGQSDSMHGWDRFDLHGKICLPISIPTIFGPKECHSIRTHPRGSLNKIDPACCLHIKLTFSAWPRREDNPKG